MLWAEDVPNEVASAVKNLLNGGSFFSAFEASKLDYGFKENTNSSDVKAEKPIRVYQIKSNKLKQISTDAAISSIIEPMDVWIVPLKDKNTIVSIVKIALYKGCWTPVSIGYNPLALAWQEITTTWPTSNNYHPMWIETTVGGHGDYFFHIPEVDNFNLTTINSVFPMENLSSCKKLSKKLDNYLNLTPSKNTIALLKVKLN